MEKQQLNPWGWQDAAGFSQAWLVDGEQPASTAVGVMALARPEMMVEVEAFAVA